MISHHWCFLSSAFFPLGLPYSPSPHCICRVRVCPHITLLWVFEFSMSRGKSFIFSPSIACPTLCCGWGMSLSSVFVFICFLVGSIHRRGRIHLPGWYYVQYVYHVDLIVIMLSRNFIAHCFHLSTHRPLVYDVSPGRFVYIVSFLFDFRTTRAVLVYVTLFIKP